ncbi:hypothetical protein FOL47_003259 [Perkinsus chesapeaki]|uniref:Intraflagellar transport protein 122 homolog n=1 Tax=Perkinsus chesapeaki TaxID=330153 RepID=A0A7J6N3R1_PERCH|nr:hypothetical protein FOL47_003259 [Perkinsus chesapeaki]
MTSVLIFLVAYTISRDVGFSYSNGYHQEFVGLSPDSINSYRSEEKYGNVVWSVAYRPDGEQLIVAAGNRVLVYDANDGDLVHSLKGHRDTVYCVSYSKQGQKFASGGADKQVIIWTSKGEGILKYNHNDSIQFLAHNPVTQQLASGTHNDIGMWSPEQKSVQKHKVPAKVLCMSWTSDGLHLALGLFNGYVSIRDKFCAEKARIVRSEPVWCLAWNPSPSKSESAEVLAVGCWDQTLAFYKLSGQELGKEHKLGFDPCSMAFFPSGDYFIVGGFDGRTQLWTRDGVLLGDVDHVDSPVWALAVRPKGVYGFAVGTDDGDVATHQITFATVHGLHQDRYAYRDNMTDVVLHHLVSDEKVRIRCKDYVKKIGVYRNRLVVQLPVKVLVYEVLGEDPLDMRYQPVDKIRQSFECSLLVATSKHFILCQDKRLQLYSITGTLEREWHLESLIRYIKVAGGVPGKEGILVGLKNGHVVNIFINNAFPTTLVKQSSPVRCIDLSCDRKKLAIVNESATLLVYDLETHQLLYQEANANSVAWNQEFPDMVAYSGSNVLSIKTGSFPSYPQKLQGFVVGFKGSKIFCLNLSSMDTIEIPQGASLYRYMSVRNYSAAYTVACLGVTDDDWRHLALHALKDMVFDVARKAFIRIRDIRYVDLLNRLLLQLTANNGIAVSDTTLLSMPGFLEELSKRDWSDEDRALVAAHALAFEGRFNEAAVLFGRAKQYHLATEMFTDLKRWEDAKKWADLNEKAIQNGEIKASRPDESKVPQEELDKENSPTEDSPANQTQPVASSTTMGLMIKQAESSEEDGDLRAAADMYLRVGQTERAAAIYMRIGALDPLIEIVRSCDPDNERDESIMIQAAACFIKHDHYMFAKEALTRAGDYESLVRLHVNENRWEEAFQLAREHPDLAEEIYLPWANWLVSNDRYEEAQEAFQKAGRSDLSSSMLRQLIDLSAEQKLYKQAGIYAWKRARNAALNDSVDESVPYRVQSDIYLAYADVVSHIEGPLVLTPIDQTMNACVFIINTASQIEELPLGVKRSNVLYVLADIAIQLQCFKIARAAYDRLQAVKLPRQLLVKAQYAALKARAASLVDNEDFSHICGRCGSTLPFLATFNGSSSTEVIEPEHCANCLHPMIRSSIGWEPLPLLEFVAADESLSVDDVISLVESEPRYSAALKTNEPSRGKESRDQNADRLDLDDEGEEGSPVYDVDSELLRTIVNSVRKLVPGEPYEPTRIPSEILRELRPEEILVIDQQRNGMGVRFYKNMMPELPISACCICGRFFKLVCLEEAGFSGRGGCPCCVLGPGDMASHGA